MKRIAIAIITLSLTFASTAWGGAKDKTSNTFVDVNSTGIINNATVKTKAKVKGCKIQVQMKPIALPDSAKVICLAEASVVGPLGGNSLVLVGEVKANQLKIKADTSETGCGSLEAVTFNPGIRCFQDDGDYLDNGTANPLAWDERCSGAGGLVIANPDPDAKELKLNPGQVVVEGVCQFAVDDAGRVPAPSTPEFARYGARTAVIP